CRRLRQRRLGRAAAGRRRHHARGIADRRGRSRRRSVPPPRAAIARPLRADLERMFTYQQSFDDPSTSVDDILLLACSDWVNERQRVVSLAAGLLAALRSPITKHVPLLSGVMSGLWDVWRKHTHVEDFGQGPILGVASGVPRLFFFALEVCRELLLNTIDN